MCSNRWKVIALGIDIFLGTKAFSIIHVSNFDGGFHDMILVSNSMVHLMESIFVSYNFYIYMSTYQGHLVVKLALANTI